MCGIVGFLRRRPDQDAPVMERVVEQMAVCIAHRGPDHRGVHVDVEAGLALGHLRLAIVDLSPTGEQPMTSPSGRFTIVFNGEAYNHADLRTALRDGGNEIAWRGRSDTETLLAGFDVWGVEETLKRTIGMFAFAVWDRRERELIIGRDRLGEKPLYYGWQGAGADRVFLFASELGAIEQHPALRREIDRSAVADLMRSGYVAAPRSIYTGIAKLMPGTVARIKADRDEINATAYWRASDAIAASRAAPFAGTPDEAVDQLEALLGDAVQRQMMADVPLGAFLSGGVDSSAVVALMQARSTRPTRTFTIGFNEEGYDEAVHAKAVARHLGTDHTELYVTPREAMNVIPSLPDHYSEPFADSSQIPTYLVSKLARTAVTVSLSGDAGDELFGGYTRYDLTSRLWERLSRIPRPLRHVAAKLLTRLSPDQWESIASVARPFASSLRRYSAIGGKVHKAAGVLASRSADDLYQGLTAYWRDPSDVVVDGAEADDRFAALDLPAGLNAVERMMAIDLVTYLPDDILTKVDRAGMAVALEGRIPMLDHRVVEFAWSLPIAYKIRDGQMKWPLRQMLYRHVPRDMIERPKMGFGVPVAAWLRGPLSDWAEALLDEQALRDAGYLHPAPIRAAWQAHRSGAVDMQYRLWPVLMFQAWLASRTDPTDASSPLASVSQSPIHA